MCHNVVGLLQHYSLSCSIGLCCDHLLGQTILLQSLVSDILVLMLTISTYQKGVVYGKCRVYSIIG